jgi:hypothetical protein
MPPKRKRKKRKKKKKKDSGGTQTSGSESALTSSAPESSAPETELYADSATAATAATAAAAAAVVGGTARFDTEYSITLRTKPPYGAKLLADKQLTINYLERLKNGKVGPLQASGKAGVGDAVIALDGVSVLGGSVKATKKMLRALAVTAKTKPFTIKFAVGPHCVLAFLPKGIISDLGLQITTSGNGHILIASIEDSSLFAKCYGRVKVGFAIVSINGRQLWGMHQNNALEAIRSELERKNFAPVLRFMDVESALQDAGAGAGAETEVAASTPSSLAAQTSQKVPSDATVKAGSRMSKLMMSPMTQLKPHTNNTTDVAAAAASQSLSSPSMATAQSPQATSTATTDHSSFVATAAALSIASGEGGTHFLPGAVNHHSDAVRPFVPGLAPPFDPAPADVPVPIGTLHVTIHKGKRYVWLPGCSHCLWSIFICLIKKYIG